MFAFNNNISSSNSGAGATAVGAETLAASMRSVELPVKKYTAVKKFATATLQKINNRKFKQQKLAIPSGDSDDSSSEGSDSESGSASVSSLSESSTSELSDIDLEIERIEKRIQIKERRLLPGMVVKPKVAAVSDTGKEYHGNYLKDEDGPKRELYNLERRQNNFYSLLDNPDNNQDEISSWHKITVAPKPGEMSNLVATKPKNTFKTSKFNDTLSLQINYRYFNDWRSHIIYYKQIKGYSHNQHIHQGNNILYRNSNNAQSYYSNRGEKKPTNPEYCSLKEIEKKDRFIYSINAVSERSIDRSFLFAENSQSGFFSKKTTGSFNSLNNQINNITAQNQCAVQFAHKLNSLSSNIQSTGLANLPNKMVVDSNKNGPLNDTHRTQVFNSSFQNAGSTSSSFTQGTQPKKSQELTPSSKVKVLPVGVVKKPSRLKEFQSEETKASLKEAETVAYRLSKTIYNTTHSYTVQASKSGRHIVSIKSDSEPVQIQQASVERVARDKAADFYAKWSKLTNHGGEIKNIIQQSSLGGVINEQTIATQRDPRQISQSLIQKKFSNLISLQGKAKRFDQEVLSKQEASKFHSETELVIGNVSEEEGVALKAENSLKMSHKRIMKKLISNSKSKILSKSQGNLDVATNSSSHFPKFIKETVRLNVM